jgi:hypothetical protein
LWQRGWPRVEVENALYGHFVISSLDLFFYDSLISVL